MDKIIAFLHKYGYVAYEEWARMVILGLVKKYAEGWIWPAILLISGIAFGFAHWRFGVKAVLGCMIAGIGFGVMFVFMPFPFNIIAPVLVHQAWASYNDRKGG